MSLEVDDHDMFAPSTANASDCIHCKDLDVSSGSMNDADSQPTCSDDDSLDDDELDRRIQEAEFMLAREQALATARGAALHMRGLHIAQGLEHTWYPQVQYCTTHLTSETQFGSASEGVPEMPSASAHPLMSRLSSDPTWAKKPIRSDASNTAPPINIVSAMSVCLLSIPLEWWCTTAHFRTLSQSSGKTGSWGLHSPRPAFDTLCILASQFLMQLVIMVAQVYCHQRVRPAKHWIYLQVCFRSILYTCWLMTVVTWVLNVASSSVYFDIMLGLFFVRVGASLSVPIRPMLAACGSWVAAQVIGLIATGSLHPPAITWR